MTFREMCKRYNLLSQISIRSDKLPVIHYLRPNKTLFSTQATPLLPFLGTIYKIWPFQFSFNRLTMQHGFKASHSAAFRRALCINLSSKHRQSSRLPSSYVTARISVGFVHTRWVLPTTPSTCRSVRVHQHMLQNFQPICSDADFPTKRSVLAAIRASSLLASRAALHYHSVPYRCSSKRVMRY